MPHTHETSLVMCVVVKRSFFFLNSGQTLSGKTEQLDLQVKHTAPTFYILSCITMTNLLKNWTKTAIYQDQFEFTIPLKTS